MGCWVGPRTHMDMFKKYWYILLLALFPRLYLAMLLSYQKIMVGLEIFNVFATINIYMWI